MNVHHTSSSTAHSPPFYYTRCVVWGVTSVPQVWTFFESTCHVVWHGLQRLAVCCFICFPVFWNQTFHKQNFKEQFFKILSHYFLYTTRAFGVTRWHSWLMYHATSRKVKDSIPSGVIRVFRWHSPSGRTMAMGSTQPLTEMSTRNSSWG